MAELGETLKQLYALESRGRELGLDRMRAACAKFGNPETEYKTVHVAGTNGKGGVSAFVAGMLKAADRKVGLYTSPHLCRFAERIQINSEPIDDDTLNAALSRVLKEAPELSFFEVATLTAFLIFKEAAGDMAVIEVGLGGRLDATNVLPPPAVCAIARISYDHMDVLGDSIEKIAGEKAAIIKPGSIVAIGKLHPFAKEVVEVRCEEVGATLVELGSPEPFVGAQLAYPRMAMFGTNLALATTIGRELELDAETLASGIEATNWPGRNELLHRSGQELTLLDCAHNPDAAVTLSHVVDGSLMSTVGSRRDIVLVFGTLKDKNWSAMLDRLEHIASRRIYVAPPIDKAAPPEPMAERYDGEIHTSVESALVRAREMVGERGLVVVTGSAFLVGPARAYLLGLDVDPPIDL